MIGNRMRVFFRKPLDESPLEPYIPESIPFEVKILELQQLFSGISETVMQNTSGPL